MSYIPTVHTSTILTPIIFNTADSANDEVKYFTDEDKSDKYNVLVLKLINIFKVIRRCPESAAHITCANILYELYDLTGNQDYLTECIKQAKRCIDSTNGKENIMYILYLSRLVDFYMVNYNYKDAVPAIHVIQTELDNNRIDNSFKLYIINKLESFQAAIGG